MPTTTPLFKLDIQQLTWFRQDLDLALLDTKRVFFQDLLDQSKALRGRIKMFMPVDTGAARDSWGTVPAGPIAAKKGLEGVWREDFGRLEVEQGAIRDSYNYIIALDQGHSQQMPAHDWITVTEPETAVRELENRINITITRLLGMT